MDLQNKLIEAHINRVKKFKIQKSKTVNKNDFEN